MPSPLPYQTVIFDLDGTLVDSRKDVLGAVQKALRASGLRELQEDEFSLLMGEGARIRTKTAFALRGVTLEGAELEEKLAEVNAAYSAALTEFSKPYPGIDRLLSELRDRGAVLGVCTNKDEASARRLLASLGLGDYFVDICGADSFGVQKPHPDHILCLLERMGRTTEAVLMVGDSVHDILAAHRAFLPAAFVSWGYGKAGQGEESPEYRCDSMEDLARVLGLKGAVSLA